MKANPARKQNYNCLEDKRQAGDSGQTLREIFWSQFFFVNLLHLEPQFFKTFLYLQIY
jgi:hypothetical protein